jgi:zinc protease
MVAAMLLEGAGDMDSRAFNEQIENHAVRLNFGADEELFYASVESLSEHRDKAFSYMAMALTQPRFDESAIERVRAQALSILKQEEQEPNYILQRQWEKLAYGSHPYGKPVLGTGESLKAITKSDMTRFVEHYLSRENLIIAVVGDITPAELAKLMDAHFSGLGQHYNPDVKVADVQLPQEAVQKVVDFDIPQTVVLFGANGIPREDPRYYAAYVMNEIIGGGGALTSKLGVEIRQKRGLAYSAYSYLNPLQHCPVWMGGFATRNEKAGEALDVLRKTLQDFSRNGPTDKEVMEAKQHLTGSFVLSLDSNADIASFLINMQLYHLGQDYFDKRNSLMEKVTKAQVKAAAGTLTDPNHLLVVMVGKPDLKKPNR